MVKSPNCPKCGAPDALPIVRGLPTEELFELERQGRVALGGCVVGDHDPEFRCRQCGEEWRS